MVIFHKHDHAARFEEVADRSEELSVQIPALVMKAQLAWRKYR
jgi:hypothetical protein